MRPERAVQSDAVVVTGFGLVSAAGAGVEALRDVLAAGAVRTTRIGAAAGMPACEGGLLGALGAPQQRALDACVLALDEALDHAALSDERRARTGLALGTALGGIEHVEQLVRGERGAGSERLLHDTLLHAQPHALPDVQPHALSRALAERSCLRGPVSTFSATCVSALYALEQACLELRTGRADAMLCGGVDTLSRFMLAGFGALNALGSPSEGGLVLGEGACFVVLERGASARARAVIAGRGLCADGTHLTTPNEDGQGMARAIGRCLADAGVSARDVRAVSLTAARSPAYARMYERVLHTVFDHEVATSSWEASVGHVLAASGAFGIAHGAMLLEEGEDHHVLALTVGFGGQNGATLLARGH